MAYGYDPPMGEPIAAHCYAPYRTGGARHAPAVAPAQPRARSPHTPVAVSVPLRAIAVTRRETVARLPRLLERTRTRGQPHRTEQRLNKGHPRTLSVACTQTDTQTGRHTESLAHCRSPCCFRVIGVPSSPVPFDSSCWLSRARACRWVWPGRRATPADLAPASRPLRGRSVAVTPDV